MDGGDGRGGGGGGLGETLTEIKSVFILGEEKRERSRNRPASGTARLVCQVTGT